MESARIPEDTPKNPQGDYLLRPTYYKATSRGILREVVNAGILRILSFRRFRKVAMCWWSREGSQPFFKNNITTMKPT